MKGIEITSGILFEFLAMWNFFYSFNKATALSGLNKYF